jgi:MerR family transcriptional regulator, light-induced transcriptional regulator
MYTIKQAAVRSGVPVQLLRAWERRYGVVEPARTSGNYRLYDDDAIARLRAMRRLVDDGWTPSTAAAHLVDLDAAEIARLANEPDSGGREGDSHPIVEPELSADFVDAAIDLDEPRFERVLDQMFSRGSFEQVTTDLVMPALHALGDGWASGSLDVAGEHAASGAVQRRLGMAFVAAGAPRGGAVVLVGLPPGALHDLGALAFATAARRAGLSVRYLGADLPVDDWVEAVNRTKADAVVVGAVIERDAKAARDVGRAIRARSADTLICFGGRWANSVDATGLGPVLILPDELTDAVETLKSELGATAA